MESSSAPQLPPLPATPEERRLEARGEEAGGQGGGEERLRGEAGRRGERRGQETG